MSDNEYQQLLGKARDAKRGGRDAWVVMSTDERVAVALVLKRPDWLTELDYMIPQAIARGDAAWVSLLSRVARVLADEDAD